MEYGLRDRAMRRREMRRDRAMRRDYSRGGRNRDMGNYEYGDREYRGKYDDSRYYGREYDTNDYNYESNRQYDRHSIPFELYGNVDTARRRNSKGQFIRDGHYYEPMYIRDYSMEEDRLSDRELMEWSKDLLEEVPEQYKSYFTVENIENKAREKGIEFKEFTFSEFYTAVLMQYTDFGKTLGTGNMDLYLSLAKDWLCDEDSGAKYGEKLARYYDEVIMA